MRKTVLPFVKVPVPRRMRVAWNSLKGFAKGTPEHKFPVIPQWAVVMSNSELVVREDVAIPHDRFLIIPGAMKCGTSTVYDWLAQHPQICPCQTKEPEYFSQRQKHRVDVEGYRDLWDSFNRKAHHWAIEASTGYTKFPMEKDIPERILAAGLEPTFIYMVRNPFERIRSHWNHLRGNPSFSLKVRPSDPYFLDVSRYHTQITRFRSVFGDRARYLVVDFEALRQPVALCQKLFRFIGVAPDFTPEFALRNVTPKLTSAELWASRNGVYRLGRFFPAGQIKEFIKGVMARTAPAKAALLTEEDEAIIRRELAGDMRALEADYGIDVKRWGF